MNFDNSNRGALFRNDKGGNERRPDYRGTINVGGKDYDLSGWLKASKKGDKYLSLSIQPKRDRAFGAVEPTVPAETSFDDEIPF
jgi:uncharacterized protein (DUF736 family)